MARIKHVVNGDVMNGWYCYSCDFTTRDVEVAAEHDGKVESPASSGTATVTATQGPEGGK